MEPKGEKVMGLCALCGPDEKKTAVLRESHFLPKAIYRYFNRFKADGTKLLLRTQEDEKLFSIGRQVFQPLLCDVCEGLMSTEGEDYYLSVMFKINAEEKMASPVYQILWNSLIPVWTAHRGHYGSGLVLSVGANFFPAIKSRQLYHYVIGMFWKATFEGWEHCPAMPLDRSIIEEMRKFLRGGCFLQNYIVRIIPSFGRAKFGAVFPTLVQGQPFFSIQQFDFYLEKDERQFRSATSMGDVPLLYTIDPVKSESAYRGMVANYIKAEKTRSAAKTQLSWL
ncbi:hypothetical protein [Xanthomonas cerealis]|uniref:hypothetical protein n=1 Tax=Xanthomonas cerealis TaxID=3390025 RepID=UPI00068C2A40|nr:hypothetical protein [Xanthomonas translucens]UKE47044.1 hypothetical protein KHA79_18715 [Xanthomonas translucens pv. cerealis]